MKCFSCGAFGGPYQKIPNECYVEGWRYDLLGEHYCPRSECQRFRESQVDRLRVEHGLEPMYTAKKGFWERLFSGHTNR